MVVPVEILSVEPVVSASNAFKHLVVAARHFFSLAEGLAGAGHTGNNRDCKI